MHNTGCEIKHKKGCDITFSLTSFTTVVDNAVTVSEMVSMEQLEVLSKARPLDTVIYE